MPELAERRQHQTAGPRVIRGRVPAEPSTDHPLVHAAIPFQNASASTVPLPTGDGNGQVLSVRSRCCPVHTSARQNPEHGGDQEDQAEDQCRQGDNRIEAPYTLGMTAVTYCRISADKTGGGLGVERQAADCRDLAAKLGLSEPEVLTDNDLSAYSGKRRPGYEQLKQGLRDGRWTTLLVWHVDRLCRNVRDLEDVVDLVNRKVAVHCVKGGEIDLETPE